MSLTKKHFEAVADILGNALGKTMGKTTGESFTAFEVRLAIAGVTCDLADYFESQNERFDEQAFLAAVEERATATKAGLL